VFRRVKEVTDRFLDAGLQPVHENCMNYGGMSWQHALELLDRCPGLKWVFDTANPVFNPIVRSLSRGPNRTHGSSGPMCVITSPTFTSRTPPGTRPRTMWTTIGPAKGRAGCATFSKMLVARLRRRPIPRTPHGRRLSRHPIQDLERGGDAQELCRIRPAAGEDG